MSKFKVGEIHKDNRGREVLITAVLDGGHPKLGSHRHIVCGIVIDPGGHYHRGKIWNSLTGNRYDGELNENLALPHPGKAIFDALAPEVQEAVRTINSLNLIPIQRRNAIAMVVPNNTDVKKLVEYLNQ